MYTRSTRSSSLWRCRRCPQLTRAMAMRGRANLHFAFEQRRAVVVGNVGHSKLLRALCRRPIRDEVGSVRVSPQEAPLLREIECARELSQIQAKMTAAATPQPRRRRFSE